MEHLHLKDLHLGNWYNRKIGGTEERPVFEPIKLGEEHFIELYAEMNPRGLCFQDLYPILISRNVLRNITQFQYKIDSGNQITWYDFTFTSKDVSMWACEKDTLDAVFITVNSSGYTIKECDTLHSLQNFMRHTADIELEYNPYKK